MKFFRWLIGIPRYRASWDVGPVYGLARRIGSVYRRTAYEGGECDCDECQRIFVERLRTAPRLAGDPS